ncbi:MAG TPA: hypothetical protein VFM02_01480 [Candidatus Paceibacterota bacterium]|nr:hypothetical protein [Candidatus Paceibacterota bacterium]
MEKTTAITFGPNKAQLCEALAEGDYENRKVLEFRTTKGDISSPTHGTIQFILDSMMREDGSGESFILGGYEKIGDEMIPRRLYYHSGRKAGTVLD